MKNLLLLFSLIPHLSYAQTGQDTTLQIEEVFSRYLPENPGCQFAVSRNGSIIFSKAWGTSDLENNIPLANTSLIEAGSVSKQFTAAAILLLEQQGKLSLDDDVRKYIPELPDYGSVIRLKQMIHHTSGIKDWGSIALLTGWGRGTKTYSNDDVLEIVSQQKSLNNIPGAEFIYSNSNYNLPAIIIKRASGMSLAEYTQKYIFIPAQMGHTTWRDNYKRVVYHRAVAYQKTDTAYEADMPNESAYGNGGLLTTAEDLLKWNAFYLSGKFGNPSLLQKQITVDTFNNRLINYYGAGLFIQTHNGLQVIRHSGATSSYRCYLEYYPQFNLSISWLSNTSQFDTSDFDIINEVEKILIKGKVAVSDSSNEDSKINLSVTKLKTYEGWYCNSRTAYGMQILLQNNKLVVNNRVTLTPVREGLFKMEDNFLLFGKSGGFKFINADNDTTSYLPVPDASLSFQEIKNYTGNYFSDETKSGITISQKNDTLLMNINSYTFYALKPTYKDAFIILGFGGIISFERDKKDNITNLRVFLSRARNVKYHK